MEAADDTTHSTAYYLDPLLKEADLSTHEHSQRVGMLTSQWIRFMKSKQEWLGFSEQDLVLAAQLHDIGKVGVLNHILNKKGPLTEDEREHLNLHVEIGYDLVCDLNLATSLAQAVRHHHERWDGHGFPLGLKRDQIPFFAQVICIVDAFDAMTSDRPYQGARSEEDAIQEIQKNAGSQFSPVLVFYFVEFFSDRKYARKSLSLLA